MGRCILIKVPMELDQHYSCQRSCSINVSFRLLRIKKDHFCQILQENKVCQAHTVFENHRKSLIHHYELSYVYILSVMYSYIPVKISDFKSCDFLVKILELQKSKQMLRIPEKNQRFSRENT